MVSFGNLSSDAGVKELDQYLLTRSYISGCECVHHSLSTVLRATLGFGLNVCIGSASIYRFVMWPCPVASISGCPCIARLQG